jgi:S1-C subfamily serine protease
MALGGMALEPVNLAEVPVAKRPLFPKGVQVKMVGQGAGPHGAASRAGFKKGDVVVSFDGRADFRRETAVLAYALTHKMPAEKVPVTVVRDGQRLELTLPMQE